MGLDSKTVATRHAPARCLVGGSGSPLLYLHGAGGMTADDPILAALAERWHVHAPFLPGYGETEACDSLRDMLDFTLHTADVAAALGLKDPILVGHSMGGMIAAEMAAVAPNDFSRLALIAPAGLWLEDHPIPDMFSLLPFEMPAYLFHDPEAGAKLITAGLKMDDPEFLKTYLIRNARQMGMAGKILFPIPERGLGERLYRIKAKTVIVWGESDRMIPPAYGPTFAA
ncbi:MAG TPA: alpha/beta fold hydrolase, partial [Caulobacteraceae bacterium]